MILARIEECARETTAAADGWFSCIPKVWGHTENTDGNQPSHTQSAGSKWNPCNEEEEEKNTSDPFSRASRLAGCHSRWRGEPASEGPGLLFHFRWKLTECWAPTLFLTDWEKSIGGGASLSTRLKTHSSKETECVKKETLHAVMTWLRRN